MEALHYNIWIVVCHHHAVRLCQWSCRDTLEAVTPMTTDVIEGELLQPMNGPCGEIAGEYLSIYRSIDLDWPSINWEATQHCLSQHKNSYSDKIKWNNSKNFTFRNGGHKYLGGWAPRDIDQSQFSSPAGMIISEMGARSYLMFSDCWYKNTVEMKNGRLCKGD